MRSYRSLKIADAIRNELIMICQSGAFEDPRLQDVEITHVELSKDSSHAKVFFRLIAETGHNSKEVEKALNNAAGYVRTLIAQALNLGYTPSFRFHFDHVAVAGERLETILLNLSEKNHESSRD